MSQWNITQPLKRMVMKTIMTSKNQRREMNTEQEIVCRVGFLLSEKASTYGKGGGI